MRNTLWLAFLLLFTFSLFAAGEKPRLEPTPTPESKVSETKPEPGSRIKGQASMQLKNQNKSILNKMELVLCSAELAARFKETRDDGWRKNASRLKFNDGYNNLDLNAIGSLAAREGLFRAQTDETGSFQINQVPVGSYLVYGQYRSNYAVAYWLVPVKVSKEGEEITIDLNETNVKEAYNRF
jgi:hypothetical protein